MWYVLVYIGMSLVIGFGITVMHIWTNRKKFYDPESMANDSKKWLDDGVKKGHLQKAVYGNRIVYHENDIHGQRMIENNEELYLMVKERPWLFTLQLLVVNGIIESIQWPKTFYLYIKKRSV